MTMASSIPLLEPTKLRSCAFLGVRKLAMKSGVVVAVVAQFGAAAKGQGNVRVWRRRRPRGVCGMRVCRWGEEDGDDGGVDGEDARGYCGGREGYGVL